MTFDKWSTVIQLRVCVLFCFIMGTTGYKWAPPLCPDQKEVYSGATGSRQSTCTSMVNRTFEKQQNENWAQHFVKECEKAFWLAKIQRWPLKDYPLKSGMYEWAEHRLYSTLTVLQPTVTLINGIYFNINLRSSNRVGFTIHDAKDKKVLARCEYWYYEKENSWKQKTQNENCEFTHDDINNIGTIKKEWSHFCIKIKLSKGRYSENLMWHYIRNYEFFNCFDNQGIDDMVALCEYNNLKQCHDLQHVIGCKSCDEGWTGRICMINKNEPCRHYVCGSHGKCTHLGGEKYSCLCEESHAGKNCETGFNECSKNPCLNNGECINDDSVGYICYCKPGFHGKKCEKDIDECAEGICKNNGICTNTYGSYKCTCRGRFTGTNCETKEAVIKHCPTEVGLYGGEKLENRTCISRALYTFPKHHKLNWAVHFEKECRKHYGKSNVYAWLPTNPLISAVAIQKISNMRFRTIHLKKSTLLNGLYYRLSRIEGAKITAEAMVNAQSKSLAKCIISRDAMGNWNSISTSGSKWLCEFHQNTLIEFGSVKSDWTFICLYLKILHNNGLSDISNWAKGNIHIFECVKDEKENNPIALCVHRPIRNCVNFEVGIGCKSCRKDMKGIFCTIDAKNPCFEFPCGSYGKCNPNGQEQYQCECESGSFGNNCEYTKNPCDAKPCQNSAKCRDEGRSYVCECTLGYRGFNCNTDINECTNTAGLCKNGGTCVNTHGSYFCQCVNGFEGKSCEINTDDCFRNPCMNSGTCVDLIADFRCLCKSGYTGKTCDMDIDECASNPCKNGGTCENRKNSYSCLCAPGYTGVRCAGETVFCDSHTCLNGGTCTIVNKNVSCSCENTHTGNRCEIERILCVDGVCGRGKCIQQEIDFKCDCNQTGFSGVRCNTEIDDCVSKPCGENGVCVDEILGYRCICKSGFMGPTCKDEINPCIMENPCRNGGTCTWEATKVKCVCPDELTGKDCTELNTITTKKTGRKKKMNINIFFIVIPIVMILLMAMVCIAVFCYQQDKRRKCKRIRYNDYNSQATTTTREKYQSRTGRFRDFINNRLQRRRKHYGRSKSSEYLSKVYSDYRCRKKHRR